MSSLPPIGKPRKTTKRRKRRGAIQLPQIIQQVEESPPPLTERGIFSRSKSQQLEPELSKLKSSLSDKKKVLKKLK